MNDLSADGATGNLTIVRSTQELARDHADRGGRERLTQPTDEEGLVGRHALEVLDMGIVVIAAPRLGCSKTTRLSS